MHSYSTRDVKPACADAIAETRRAWQLTGNPIDLASLAHGHAMGGTDDEARLDF